MKFLGVRRAECKHYLIIRCVLTPAGPSRNQLLLELPFLTTHRAEMTGLLGMQPLHDAVNVEAVRALAPDWNSIESWFMFVRSPIRLAD